MSEADGVAGVLQTKLRGIAELVRGRYDEDALGEEEWVSEYGSLMEAVEMLDGRLDDLNAENEQLHEENERLRERVATLEQRIDDDGQRGKVAKIVEIAKNRQTTEKGVVMTAADIVDATGVSRRYAYDLIESLPEKYDFLLSNTEVDRYGSLEMATDDLPKGLIVVFDDVHSDLASVNKFTTRTSRKGGHE